MGNVHMGGGIPLDIKSFPPGSDTCFKTQHSHFKTKRHQRVRQLLPAQTWAVVQSLHPTKARCCLNRSCMASGLGPGLTALPCAMPRGHKAHTLGNGWLVVLPCPMEALGAFQGVYQEALSIPHCGQTQKASPHSALSSIRQCQGRGDVPQGHRRVFPLAKTTLVP